MMKITPANSSQCLMLNCYRPMSFLARLLFFGGPLHLKFGVVGVAVGVVGTITRQTKFVMYLVEICSAGC